MTYLHCEVHFSDYAKWKASMDANAQAQQNAGLHLKQLWRGIEDANSAFFILEVEDIARAKIFLDPAKIEAEEKAATASNFKWHFVESIPLPYAG